MVRPRKVLLIGGHGRTAHYITTLLLSHGHTVYSLIRNTSQIDELLALAKPFAGTLVPIVHDLNGISSREVQEILATGSQDSKGLKGGIRWVIWAAGAKSNQPRHPFDQLSVERDAAMKFIDEARGEGVGPGKSVRRVIMISACISRKEAAYWWNDEEKSYWEGLRRGAAESYIEAKSEVDELLVSECRMHVKRKQDANKLRKMVLKKKLVVQAGKEVEEGLAVDDSPMESEDEAEQGSFSAVSVRPGTLGDQPGTGKCELGKTRLKKEPLSREDLARVVVELCELPGRHERGGGIGCRWLDVGVGEEEIGAAVERCIREDVDCSLPEGV